ncbi:MAG: hypothetical protein ACMG6E_10240 [Candidatus Roizmanbacteria bacterium]
MQLREGKESGQEGRILRAGQVRGGQEGNRGAAEGAVRGCRGTEGA